MATHPRHGGETPLAGAGVDQSPPHVCVNACIHACVFVCVYLYVQARSLSLATVHFDLFIPPTTLSRKKMCSGESSFDGRLRQSPISLINP